MANSKEIIDHNRYPIFASRQAEAKVFFENSRKTYEDHGVLTLPEFITKTALRHMANQAAAVAVHSYKQVKHHNVYLADNDAGFDDNHPRNHQLTTTNSTIAYADIQADAWLRDLYTCPELHAFIAHVTGNRAIHPYVDALSPLNIGISRPGETLAWHFDTSEFATTLLLQAADSGGLFEYIPQTRTENDPAYETVARLLDGDRSKVQTLDMPAGTLVLFRGRHSIHRVTPVAGQTTRMIAILTYDKNPGQKMNAFTRKKFYGRAA